LAKGYTTSQRPARSRPLRSQRLDNLRLTDPNDDENDDNGELEARRPLQAASTVSGTEWKMKAEVLTNSSSAYPSVPKMFTMMMAIQNTVIQAAIGTFAAAGQY
jgi:hypothetical protein